MKNHLVRYSEKTPITNGFAVQEKGTFQHRPHSNSMIGRKEIAPNQRSINRMKNTVATARKEKSKVRAASSKQGRSQRWRGEQAAVFAAGALVAVVFICYANSLGNDFVFDDEFLVPAYSRVQTFSQLVNTLLDSYRPMRNVSYAIDFLVWGLKPFGFHLTNVLIHAANVVLVFALIRRFSVKLSTAIVAALIFAVHPIQTDSVSYVSGRRDILFTLFYLAAFNAYLIYREKASRTWIVLFLGLWGLSVMSKEMAVSLPLVILLWNFCGQWKETGGSLLQRSIQATKAALLKDKWLYAFLAVASFGFGFYAIFVQRASGRTSGSGVEYWGGSLYATLLTVVRVHAWYLKQLIYPTPIAQYFGAFDISTSLLEWRVVVAIAVVGSVLIAGVILLKKETLAAFAIFSYFAILAPVSQLIPHHELLADHYLYLPMISFSLLIGLVVSRVSERGRQPRLIAYGLVSVFILTLAGMTVSRNRDWKDELAVWEANYKSVPNSPRASYNLGGLYLTRDPQKSEALLKESITSDPTFEPAYLALAKLYVTQKRTAEAEDLIQKGLGLIGTRTRSFVLRNPWLLKSQFTTTLAAAKWEAGNREATEQLLLDAVRLYPGNINAYESLANLYHDKDRGNEEQVLRQAIGANPSAFEVRARLAALMIEGKRYDEALTAVQELLDLNPTERACEKARPYLAGIKSGVPNSMEQRPLATAVQLVLQKCAR
jgi:tetratricopeptide (TPR) repeat protein